MDIKKMTNDLLPYIIEFRRDIHQHAEPSMQEFRTSQRVAEELDKIGVSYRMTEPTGVIAEIKGTKGESSHCILLRGDMDALSITEETGLPFTSVNEGIMHACGHDTHTSMLLGAATILNQIKDQFAGTIRFVFQPGEETGQGAVSQIAQGAADGVDLGMALHINSDYKVNEFAICPGYWGAACDKFTIKVTGRTCHGAMPEQGVDAIYCAAAIITQLQTMVSREFPPTEAVVVSVGQINAGSRFNIIAGEAIMEGTCRCFNRDVYNQLPTVMERIASNIAKALRCEAEVTFDRVTQPLVCDEELTALLKNSILKITGDESAIHTEHLAMGGEDFAAFGEYMPITFAKIGGGLSAPMHSNNVVFDESTFPYGMACYVQFALDALEKLNQERP